jgi:hypothetical protein
MCSFWCSVGCDVRKSERVWVVWVAVVAMYEGKNYTLIHGPAKARWKLRWKSFTIEKKITFSITQQQQQQFSVPG